MSMKTYKALKDIIEKYENRGEQLDEMLSLCSDKTSLMSERVLVVEFLQDLYEIQMGNRGNEPTTEHREQWHKLNIEACDRLIGLLALDPDRLRVSENWKNRDAIHIITRIKTDIESELTYFSD